MGSLRALGLGVCLSLTACAHTPEQPASTDELLGVWHPQAYVLADGTRHAVRGHIFFAGDSWTVLFFVLDAEGHARRGSAEGGRYERTGRELTFFHRHHLSAGEALPGLPGSELRMETREDSQVQPEPTTIELSPQRLVISFPSGNRMDFTR